MTATLSAPTSEEVSGLVRAGRAAIRLADYEAARTTFERAVALDPDNQTARDGLREVQRRLGAISQPQTVELAEYCYRHAEAETALHCTACGRPICVRCMTTAAVGQLCPECRKGRRAVNYQVAPGSLLKGGLISLVVAVPAAALASMMGAWLLLMFAAGPAAAEVIVRAVDWATRCKRGRAMQITVALSMTVGGLLAWLAGSWFGYGDVLGIALFILIGVSTAVARLR